MFGQKSKSVFEFAPKSEQMQIKTLISEGCKFEGNLYSPAFTRIDGIVNGNLTGESGLIIGEKGKITGDVASVEVIVFGQVLGNIKCHKLDIKKNGAVFGDINTSSFQMESGAVYNGTCKMEEKKEANTDSEVFKVPGDEEDI